MPGSLARLLASRFSLKLGQLSLDKQWAMIFEGSHCVALHCIALLAGLCAQELRDRRFAKGRQITRQWKAFGANRNQFHSLVSRKESPVLPSLSGVSRDDREDSSRGLPAADGAFAASPGELDI